MGSDRPSSRLLGALPHAGGSAAQGVLRPAAGEQLASTSTSRSAGIAALTVVERPRGIDLTRIDSAKTVRIWRVRGATASAVIAIALTQGCGGRSDGGATLDPPDLFVGGVLALQHPDCLVFADPSSARLLSGTLDRAIRDRYDAAVLVGSELSGPASRVTLESAEVSLGTIDGAKLHEFTFPASALIGPALPGGPAAWNVTSVPLVDDAAVLGDADMIVAEMRVSGTTLAGEPAQSQWFPFVIRICTGCLVSYPVEAIDPITGACVHTQGVALPDPPCRPGQDHMTDCRLL